MTISLAVPDVLIARAKSGDVAALEALYRAFETPVYNLARRILRNPEDAEDVLQETFLEVVRSIRSFRGDGHLWGWIRRIASSKALMRIRRHQVRAEEEFDEQETGASHPVSVPARVDRTRACGACWKGKERHDDALYDGRAARSAGERGVCVGAAASGELPFVPRGARGAVSARGAAQGVTRARAGAGPVVGGARRHRGAAGAAPQALGRVGGGARRRRGPGGRGRVQSVRERACVCGRARAGEAPVGITRSDAATLRSRLARGDWAGRGARGR